MNGIIVFDVFYLKLMYYCSRKNDSKSKRLSKSVYIFKDIDIRNLEKLIS